VNYSKHVSQDGVGIITMNQEAESNSLKYERSLLFFLSSQLDNSIVSPMPWIKRC